MDESLHIQSNQKQSSSVNRSQVVKDSKFPLNDTIKEQEEEFKDSKINTIIS